MKIIKYYGIITLSIVIMAIGVYFFKFPNNFCFGGVTGMAVVVAKVLPISAGTFTFYANAVLLVIGLLFLGKNFAFMTAYASILLSVCLMVFEKLSPLSEPISNEPLLELLFAIALPAIGSALLFNIGASSGGTDVLAMLLKKYTKFHIGLTLFMTDVIVIVFACFVFDIKTALYSFVGLTVKSFMVDGIIESINLCKSFNIICDTPNEICDYIVHNLNRGATIIKGTGAYTNEDKYVIFTVMSRAQAIQLRQYIHQHYPNTFIMITNSSEIIGKGFITI